MELLNMTSEMIHVVKFLLPAFRMATQNCLTTRTSAGKRLISPTRSVKFSEPRFALAESNTVGRSSNQLATHQIRPGLNW